MTEQEMAERLAVKLARWFISATTNPQPTVDEAKRVCDAFGEQQIAVLDSDDIGIAKDLAATLVCDGYLTAPQSRLAGQLLEWLLDEHAILSARVVATEVWSKTDAEPRIEVDRIDGLEVRVEVIEPGLSADRIRAFFAGQRAFPISSLSEAQTRTWFETLDRCESGLLSWLESGRPHVH